mmetsp:Transcript_63044/g.111972  ORF Transcript_63044/g.111972 Transcript_63044/m.111972 type:complete len:515 (+) Transcript_63044:73-1617(+)
MLSAKFPLLLCLVAQQTCQGIAAPDSCIGENCTDMSSESDSSILMQAMVRVNDVLRHQQDRMQDLTVAGNQHAFEHKAAAEKPGCATWCAQAQRFDWETKCAWEPCSTCNKCVDWKCAVPKGRKMGICPEWCKKAQDPCAWGAACRGCASCIPQAGCEEGGDSILHGRYCTPVCRWGRKAMPLLSCYKGNTHPRFEDVWCELPDTVPPPGIKRGMSIWTWAALGEGKPKNGQADILKLLNPAKIGWWYDWRTTVVSGQNFGGRLTGAAWDGKIPFVPMIYSEDWLGDYHGKKARNPASLPGSSGMFEGSQYLLAFNEPWMDIQANISAERVAELWPQFQVKAEELEKKIGKKVFLVSPTIEPPHAKDLLRGEVPQDASGWDFEKNKTELGVDGWLWSLRFFELVEEKNLRVDAVSVHDYSRETSDLNARLTYVRYKFGRPVWLTEFNKGDGFFQLPREEHVAYMKQTLPMLDDHPWVVRYAWMSSFAEKRLPGCFLVDPITYKLNDLGQLYNSM